MISTYLAAFAVLLALAALVVAAQAVKYARDCTQWIELNNKQSLELKKLMEIETELTMHADLIEGVRKSMHKLRSRIHMRNVNAGNDATGAPDPDKDPQGWKRYMNEQLTTGAKEHE